MKNQSSIVAAYAALALSSLCASAGTVTSSPSAPIINDADIANYGDITETDKWSLEGNAFGHTRGQSFATGLGAVRLRSISYQTSTNTPPTSTFIIRVGKLVGTSFTAVYSETAAQTSPSSAGNFITWTFANPPILEPSTVYGIDIGWTSSTGSNNSNIPYLNVTGNEYTGGSRYTSGASTAGVGTASALYKTGDMIFHIDLESPIGGGFSFVAGNPPDNSAAALIRPELVATFSKNLVLGSGNITIRNLSDATETILSVNNPAVSVSGNLLKISSAGLLAWNKSYAVRIAPGTILDDASNPFVGIADDATWNFTYAPADPFIEAIASLKNHIIGTGPLDATQIAAVFDTVANNKTRFSESAQTISAVFDLVAAYDAWKGAAFLLNTGVNFNDRNTQAKTVDWTLYQVMQTIMDEIYVSPVIAAHETLLNGFKLGVSANFPGACAPPTNPLDTRTTAVNASFVQSFGRETQMWRTPARKPTGAYVAPGTFATVTVPPALVNAGYRIRVGCHSWDLETRRSVVRRLDRATCLYPITSTSTKVASPYGGGIYIEVPFGANAGIVNVSVTGAVRSTYFSLKSFHTTTPAEWLIERSYIAPWVDFQTDKFMTQVPRKWIYNIPDPTQAMLDWDSAMDANNDLMGFPRIRGKESMYCQADIILRSVVHTPGYPAVNQSSNPNSEVSPLGNAGSYLVRGPGQSAAAANIEMHEQGHAYFFPKFGGEQESTVNLLHPAMLIRKFGYDFDTAHRASRGYSNTFMTVDNTAVSWMCVFNFSPREVPMASAEKSYQLKGHAKFMDIARLFGWEGMDAFWRSFMLDDANGISYGVNTDDLLLRLSRHVGKDIRPLFHFWGIHPQNPATLAAAISAENIPASVEIRDQLLHYKSLVPANNAAFRTFATSWWGRQPSINGAWEDREHARQWDTTALYGPGDQQRSEATNPGEIYNENSANDIRNRVQELLDLYFPSAISPATMTFAIEPSVATSTSVGMVATSAVAAIGPMQYFFDETSGNPGGTDSAWQNSPIYTDSGLTTGLTYSYTVTARDGLGNMNVISAVSTVTPTAAGDIISPTPSPMTFATAPASVDPTTITMSASDASDVSGVEYFFENITTNTNSGWQNSPVFTQTNLQPSTLYSYRVQARDKSANQNVTAFSAAISTSTADLPDETPPQIIALSPLSGSIVSNLSGNLVATCSEPILSGNGTVTLKNLTDGTQAVFSIGNAALTISGNTLTINPPTNLIHGKTYAIQISNGAFADLSNNPFFGINDDESWTFSTILSDPLAIPGGPYVVALGSSLTLDGSASEPSNGQSLVSYEWDLNQDGNFTDAIGATPASISSANLLSIWGMSQGRNTIALKVTDTAGKIGISTTTVKLGFALVWDANGASANQTDGAGAWLNANQWRDEGVNTAWSSGASASFGNAGSGGNVTLASPTSAASLTFQPFTGTYTIGTAATTLTISSGVIQNAGAGTTNIISPLALTAAQTWVNNSTSAVNVTGGLNNAGNALTFNGTGTLSFASTANVISGSGGITVSGPGRIILGAGGTTPVHTYSGTTMLNGGSIMISNNLGTGNFTINNGFLDFYYGGTFTRTLGSGAGQVQILGGTSGFSHNASIGSTVRLNNSATFEVVWGSAFFNPSVLLLQASNAQTTSSLTFDNRIDLNGATRTITSAATTTGAGSATISQVIRNSQSSLAGLVKAGSGRLNLNAANTYNGGTTIQAGTLQLGNATALGLATAPLTISGGLLNLNDQVVSIGNLNGTGGIIANNANGARVFTIGSGNAGGGDYQGIIANKTGTGTGSIALTKTGSGTITLNGANTYTGATLINGGTLALTGSTQATSAISFANNSILRLAIGSPVVASAAAVNFANGRIEISGTPVGQGQALLTAASFTGTPVLVNPIPNYELVVIGNALWINSTTDQTAPNVVNITDSTVGGTIVVNNAILFNVTLNEDIDASTVDASDFGNAGTATGVIGSITETSPGVLEISVLPTSVGTFQLRINNSAVINDLAGNSLDTDPAILDDTILTVERFNIGPVALSQNLSTNEDTALAITLTGTDADLDPLTYSIVAQPTNGTLSGIAPNVTYTPNANFNGNDTVTFRVNDGLLNSAIATISISIAAENDAPVALVQNVTTPEDTSLPIVLAGTDVENSALTFSIVTPPANGSLSGIAPNLTFVPNENFNGSTSFSFKANDGTIDSAIATVAINVTAVNDVPVAVAQSVITNENAPLAIILAGSDVDLNTLSYAIVTAPTNGTLTGAPPNVTYMPAAGFDGSDSFTFKLNDGTSDSLPATVSITITSGVSLVWDANGASANLTDGAGAWLNANQWRDGAANAAWLSGAAAEFGNGGAGGAVTLASPTTAATMTFNAFTGTYTIGSATSAITLNNGIVKNAGSGVANIISPVVLGWQQNWTSNSSALNLTGGLNNNGHTLSFGGTGSLSFASTANIISGSGGLTVNGPGKLILGAGGTVPVHTYSGPTIINGGSILVSGNNVGSGNLQINNGFLDFYYSGTFTRSLGNAAGQVQIPGGVSGFSHGASVNATVRLNNSATYEVVWGSPFFNPSTLILQDSSAQSTSSLTFDNKIDLNGANRTIATAASTTGAGSATISQIIRNSQANPAGLIKTGTGRLILTAANTYNGGTTIQSGTLQLGNSAALGPLSSSLTINGGLLNLSDQSVFIGNLTGTGGIIANDGGAARTFTIGSSNATGGLFQGVIANKTGTGNGSIALSKVGTGTITLAGANTYTGATSLFGGTLAIGASNTMPNSSAITITNATLSTSANVSDSCGTLDISGAASINLGSGATLAFADSSGIDWTGGALAITGPFTPGASIRFGTSQNALTPAQLASISVVGFSSLSLDANGFLDTDTTPPTLASGNIVDSNGGASIIEGSTLSYTVTFSEDMDHTSVTATDFGNAGTCAGNIGVVVEIAPGVFSVPVTTTSPGTLRLQLNAAAIITDASGNALNTTVAILDDTTIIVTPLNTAPLAVSQNLSTAEDTALPVILTATDIDGNPLTYSIVTAPTNGTLSGIAPNVTYTPAANFSGADSFTFVANDGSVNSALATVSLTVTAVNDLPAAIAQNLSTAEDTALPIILAGTDIDNEPLTYSIVTPPTNGTLSGIAPNVTYTPAANFSGADSFTFVANDGTVNSALATVSITVTAVNDLPAAIAQSLSTAEDTALPITLAGTDVDNEPLTYSIVTPPTNGTLSGIAPNLTYTPTANYNGADSFTFVANDGTADSALAIVSLTVTAVNDLPAAIAQSLSTAEDTALPITLAGTDVDNEPLTYSIVTPPTNGTLSGIAPNLTYTPTANYNGADSFTFVVNDGTVDSTLAIVSLTVTAVNDAPTFAINPMVLAAASINVAYTGQTLAGLATDIDVSDTLTYSKVSGPTWLNVASNGALTGTPLTGTTGVNTFVIRATDSASATVEADITINVTALPFPWTTVDIGTGMLAGSASFNAGTYTQSGSGVIGGTSDRFTYSYQTITGNGSITLRISALQNTGTNSRVGVMIRESLAPNAKHVFMGLTGSNAYRYTRRTATGGTTTNTSSSTATMPNGWVLLTREGTTIIAYKSTNGSQWNEVGRVTNTAFGNTCYIGLAVSSGSDTTLNTSAFSNVLVIE